LSNKKIKLSRLIKNSLLEAYFIMRVPLIYALKLLPRGKAGKTDTVSDILVIRLDRMGDLILSLPVIDNLKLQYPRARITLLVKPYLEELASMIKSVNSVIVYEGYFTTVAKLKKHRYDIAIDMLYDYKLIPALLAYLSGAPVRIGFRWGFREIFFTASIQPQDLCDKHMVDLSLELLKPLGTPIVIKEPALKTGQPATQGKKMIAIHPGGHYPSQRWPAASFAELARKIMDELKEEIVFMGGDEDALFMDEIISAMGDRRFKLSLSGIKDMALLLEDCKLLICNNSGPLHLAVALGLPTVSTMGPTDPVLWWPRGTNSIVLKKDKKMEEITVDDMYEAVKKALQTI
jgi:ADP-heptose:LPS heptosyltransferase